MKNFYKIILMVIHIKLSNLAKRLNNKYYYNGESQFSSIPLRETITNSLTNFK